MEAILRRRAMSNEIGQIKVLPQNIVLLYVGNILSVAKFADSGNNGNGKERCLFQKLNNGYKYNSLPKTSYSQADVYDYLDDKTCLVEIPSGSTRLKLEGTAYFNSRNPYVLFISSNLARLSNETLVTSFPASIIIPTGATYLYVRITRPSTDVDYITPEITFE